MSPVGLVLAAGAGSRMGRPKALVHDPDGTPWLVRCVEVLRAAGCDEVVVVLGARADEAAHRWCLSRVKVVVADDWADGMAASLRCGLRALAAAADEVAVLVHPGRSPRRHGRRRTPRVLADRRPARARWPGRRTTMRRGTRSSSGRDTLGARSPTTSRATRARRPTCASTAARSSSAGTSRPEPTRTLHRATRRPESASPGMRPAWGGGRNASCRAWSTARSRARDRRAAGRGLRRAERHRARARVRRRAQPAAPAGCGDPGRRRRAVRPRGGRCRSGATRSTTSASSGWGSTASASTRPTTPTTTCCARSRCARSPTRPSRCARYAASCAPAAPSPSSSTAWPPRHGVARWQRRLDPVQRRVAGGLPPDAAT